jgi:two-component system NtrC family sensor kinase
MTADMGTASEQSEKLVALGQIAAGIAHELATPIQYVGDNLQYLQFAFDELLGLLKAAEVEGTRELAAEIPEALAHALEGTRRASEIIRAMRFLAHPGRMQPVAADINEGLTATLLLARSRLSRLARVTTEWGTLPYISCHPGLINQVFLNLLINAGDAIETDPDRHGRHGEIHISTKFDGKAIEITVRDNGCGIAPEHAGRVFEPFYTTKMNGLGTGQGLAISRRLVEEVHGGNLTFRANTDRGVTFIIRLPVSDQGTA